MTSTTTRPTLEQRGEAVRSLAAAMERQGIDVEAATAYVLAVLDTSSQSTNRWAADIVADEYGIRSQA